MANHVPGFSEGYLAPSAGNYDGKKFDVFGFKVAQQLFGANCVSRKYSVSHVEHRHDNQNKLADVGAGLVQENNCSRRQ